MTPEEAQAQIRFCEEQLVLEQEQADRETEMDTKLQLKWVNENWDKIKITLDECDTWRSNRGARPDTEMDQVMEVLKEYKIDNLSQATIEVYCDELERRAAEETTDDSVIDDSFDSSSTSSSSSASGSSSEETDYGFDPEKDPRNFPDRMYNTFNDEAKNDLITNLEICEAYPLVCCPLFEADYYSAEAFSNDTIDALNSAEIKGECAKYEFMSCCVFTDLCSIYSDLAHCQPANSAALVEAVKLQFRTASTTSTSTTTTPITSTTTKKTTTTVINSDVEPVASDEDQSFGGIDSRIGDWDSSITEAPINDKIIGVSDENAQNGGVSTKSPEEIQEIEEDAASRGITILIVVIGLIVLMAIAVIVSKHFFAGDGEGPVATGEDDSLLVTNATQKPLDQIPEDNEAQQAQQQAEETIQQQAQEEQFQQQQVQN